MRSRLHALDFIAISLGSIYVINAYIHPWYKSNSEFLVLLTAGYVYLAFRPSRRSQG